MFVTLQLRGEETQRRLGLVEAVDPIGLPGFIAILQHNMEEPDKHLSYVWPCSIIESMVIETEEGERFEHTTQARWQPHLGDTPEV